MYRVIPAAPLTSLRDGWFGRYENYATAPISVGRSHERAHLMCVLKQASKAGAMTHGGRGDRQRVSGRVLGFSYQLESTGGSLVLLLCL